MWQELLTVLGQLNSQYEKLLAVARQKRSALVAVDFRTVERLRPDEEAIIEAIRSAEDTRLAVLKKLAASQPDVRPDINRQELFRLAPAEYRTELKRVSQALSETVAAAQDESDANTLLLESALQAITYKQNRLSAVTVEPTYGSSGQNVVKNQRNSLDFDA